MRDCDSKCELAALATTMKWIGIVMFVGGVLWVLFSNS